MKKITLLLLGFCLSVLALAQENTVKLRVGSLLIKTAYLEYERAISDRSSFTIGFHRTFPTNLEYDAFVEQDEEEQATFGSPELGGYGITAEFRYYTSSAKGPQQGFYIAPFLRHSAYKISQGGYVEKDNGDQIAGEASVKLGNNVGFGFGIGTQWLLGEHFVIDATWIGLGVSMSNVKIEYKTFDKNEDLREASDDIYEEFAGESWVKDIDIQRDKATITSTGFLLPIIRGNFSIGYRF